MGKGLSMNFYTQANAGMLRNADNTIYNNLGATVGTEAKLKLNDKNLIFGGVEIGAGTALSAEAMVGYKRKLDKKVDLVFTANASVNKSLTEKDKFNFGYVHDYSVTQDGVTQTDVDNGNVNESWHPGNLKLNGTYGLNRNTKWGNYELGLEFGYEKALSKDIKGQINSKTSVDINETTYSETATFNYNRKPEEGFYASPYAKAKINLSKNGAWQAIGKVDFHELKAGVRWNF